jgi:beta-ureidopropionase / N-carbamoyl-L-amino-acid hydrolase
VSSHLTLPNLDGLYEHSPWVVDVALAQNPQGFQSMAALKAALALAVESSNIEKKLALIRAHPELASKAKQVSPTARQRSSPRFKP